MFGNKDDEAYDFDSPILQVVATRSNKYENKLVVCLQNRNQAIATIASPKHTHTIIKSLHQLLCCCCVHISSIIAPTDRLFVLFIILLCALEIFFLEKFSSEHCCPHYTKQFFVPILYYILHKKREGIFFHCSLFLVCFLCVVSLYAPNNNIINFNYVSCIVKKIKKAERSFSQFNSLL